ncbi:MAG TPA: VWA domain-containing protein [Candidatus Acidoferrales bacterium]|nr:VWA domain-containing protein [Candidatus Acidoferrales bacterium]
MKKTFTMCALLLLPACALAQTTNPRASAAQSGSQAAAPQPAKPAQATAQNPSTQPQKPATLRITTKVVLVPVTVKNADGDLVPDLQQNDFRIFQDDKEQQIKNFWDEAFPVSAVVLLDDDLPTGDSQKVLKSLDSIAAGFSASDEVALVRFDEYPKTVLDFTPNNDALFAKLKEIRTNPKDALDSRVPGSPSTTIMSPPMINGHTIDGAPGNPMTGANYSGVTKHLDDAVHYAAEMLRTRSKDRRKIIVIVSDGTNDRHNQWSFNNTLQLLFSANVTVYAVSVDSPADVLALRGAGRLSQYTNSTGGDVIAASSPNRMEALYSKLVEEARNQYTLGFDPTNTVGHGNCHTIEVRVERPGLNVTARKGYCATLSR